MLNHSGPLLCPIMITRCIIGLPLLLHNAKWQHIWWHIAQVQDTDLLKVMELVVVVPLLHFSIIVNTKFP